MSSAKDRLAWQNLLTDEPDDVVADAKRTLDKARSKTARGKGFELRAVAGNDTALAGLSLFIAHERANSADAGLEKRIQKRSGISLADFRSSLQELKRALGAATTPKTTPSRSGRSSARKSAGGSNTTTPTKKGPVGRPVPASSGPEEDVEEEEGEETDEEDRVILVAARTPPSGSRQSSARKSAIASLTKGSGSRHVSSFEPGPTPSRTPTRALSRASTSHLSDPDPDEDGEDGEGPEATTPTKKRRLVRPSSSSSSRTPHKTAREPTPPPPEPMSAFGGEYAPVPSRAKDWADSPWDVGHDDLMWPFSDRDGAEGGERARVSKEWDAWQTARAFARNGWPTVRAT